MAIALNDIEYRDIGKAIDETGNVYGRLTVLGRGPNTRQGGSRWYCECECGNIVLVTGGHLRAGSTVSCGCRQLEIITDAGKSNLYHLKGKRFGRLTVVERAENGKWGAARWRCVCECGGEVITRGDNLRSGNTRSCGCLGEENLRKQHKTGEDSTNWRGGKSFEPYDARFNDLFKEGVRNRDLHACQLCGLPEEENGQALDVHHVDYNKKNTVKSNCISLCVSCHGRTHHNREYWMNYFRDNFEFIFPGENIGTEARWVS